MYREGKVECCTSRGHGSDFSLRCKDKYLGSKEVQLDSIEKVHGIGLWVVEYLLDGAQPVVQLALVLRIFGILALLIFPVSSKSLLCHLVHAVASYLHLYPSSLLRHQGYVQCLIAIGLRMTQPVAQSVWMTLVDFRYGYIDVETLVDFFFALVGCEDDAHSQDVVHLVKGHMLVLHLVPDGVGRLYAFLNLILYAHLVEGFLDRSCKLVEQFVT